MGTTNGTNNETQEKVRPQPLFGRYILEWYSPSLGRWMRHQSHDDRITLTQVSRSLKKERGNVPLRIREWETGCVVWEG